MTIPAEFLPIKRSYDKLSARTPEGRVVAAVKKWAKDKPDVYICRVVQAGEAGTPDFLLCVRGLFVGVECKATGQTPRNLQFRRANDIERAGGVFLWGDTQVLLPALEKIYTEQTK